MSILVTLVAAALACVALEVGMAPLPQARSGAPVRSVDALGAIYADAAGTIARDLGRAVQRLAADPESRGGAFALARASELAAQVRATLMRLERSAGPLLQDAAETAQQRGLTEAGRQLDALGIDAARDASAGGAAVSFAGINEGAVDIVARDMAGRLNQSVSNFGEQAKTMFRTLSEGPLAGSAREAEVNLALARGLITGDPRVADRALREMFRDPDAPEAETYRRLGAQQIQVGGWTGPVRAYTEMVVRTRTREASVAARHEALAEVDIELVQITGSNSSNFCTRFLGLVCSIAGNSPDYPALSDLPGGGPPFHPNCTKDTTAYVPDLASKGRVERAGQARSNYEKAKAAGTLTDPVT